MWRDPVPRYGRAFDNQYCSLVIIFDSKICLNSLFALSDVGEECRQAKCTRSCPAGWAEKEGACYFWGKTNDKKTWEEADKFCRNQGGRLVTVTSKAVNDYLIEEKKQRHWSNLPIWIGGSDKGKEGVWKWSDCSFFRDHVFTAWATLEPDNSGGNQHCLELWHNKWNDNVCKKKNNFVCTTRLCPPGSFMICDLDKADSEMSFVIVFC